MKKTMIRSQVFYDNDTNYFITKSGYMGENEEPTYYVIVEKCDMYKTELMTEKEIRDTYGFILDTYY